MHFAMVGGEKFHKSLDASPVSAITGDAMDVEHGQHGEGA